MECNFCDYTDQNGATCNNPPSLMYTKSNKDKVYLCEECLWKPYGELDFEQACYINK